VITVLVAMSRLIWVIGSTGVVLTLGIAASLVNKRDLLMPFSFVLHI